ncbi:MAG TPA: hypothetical protein VF658_03115 [Pyrinomonadaceae bacterium]|jgi:hypothetical protein
MLKVQRTIAIIFSLALLLSAGCSKETIKHNPDLAALRNELVKEYKEKEIDVTLEGSDVLGISFINSSLNNLGELERGNKAQEIASFATQHYSSINHINKIWVAFVVYKNYIVFYYSYSVGAYVFDKNGDPPAASNYDGPQGVVSISYNPTTNETHFYVSQNLRVLNEAKGGIMLFPHFNLPGDKVSAPRVATPKTVILDFSTYSEKRMFPNNPKLVIDVDGQKVFSGNAKTTNVMGDEQEKSVNEFLSQEISYSQFLQITDGEKVRFALGAKTFELTAEHLAVLRAMRKCVEELRCT